MKKELVFGLVVGLAAPGLVLAGVRAAHDFDGDGIQDVAVYHRDAANFYVRKSSDGQRILQQYGWKETIPVSGDFDGDQRADFAVFHRKTGTWYILQSSNGQQRTRQFGFAGTQPVPGDYNGDGITDLALYERLNGAWYFLLSPAETFVTFQWGWRDARPCPADYDGDGDDDAAVYHSAAGDFYIRNENGTPRIVDFGWFEVQPKTGDFNGDGLADICVYDPNRGDWYFLLSPADTFLKERYGWGEGNAVPGQFDGDARADKAIYHPETGTWYIWRSQFGDQVIFPWGWPEGRAVKSWAHGAPEDIRVMCFGDDLTYGRGSSSGGPATAYPVLLEKRLKGSFGGDWLCKNEGLVGEDTGAGVQRFDGELVQNNPDITIILEGWVDLQTEFEEPEPVETNEVDGVETSNTVDQVEMLYDEVRANLYRLCLKSRTRAAKTILASIPPVVGSPEENIVLQERIEACNPEIFGAARSAGATWAPVYDTFIYTPGWESVLIRRPPSNVPNDAGYRAMANLFYDIIQGALLQGEIY